MKFRVGYTLPLCALAALLATLLAAAMPAQAQTIIDQWNSIKTPPAPALQPVNVDPATTALLLLDFVTQTCNARDRPRCLASLPTAKHLLGQARAGKMLVVYSYVSSGTLADTLPELAPIGGEPNVQSGPDKFLGTDLERILKDRGIKTVIVTGTDAAGAVMATGEQAALRGFNVIVPVDAMSSGNPFTEKYVAFHFTSAPGVSHASTLTRAGMIKF
jgi:nicotinamidase-related amidase